MARIGHGWMTGAIDIYQEHEATQIVASAIQELIEEMRSPMEHDRSPLAVGASAEGDPYVLPGLLGELVLREKGWRVRNLGTNLPLRSLAQATLALRPGLIFASASIIKDEDVFLKEYESFYEAVRAVNSAVILGGRALTPELRSRLVYASFGDRMVHLAEFADRIAGVGRALGPATGRDGNAFLST
jgi:methanogenic corrinoid protein MtbC1